MSRNSMNAVVSTRKIICDPYKSATRKPVLKNNKILEPTWIDVDCAEYSVLGRLASKIAFILRGKGDVQYTSHVRNYGVNCKNYDAIIVTGNKSDDKMYHHHTGYFGGLKSTSYNDLVKKDNTRAVFLAVKGMLPRGYLKRNLHKFLKFVGDNHD